MLIVPVYNMIILPNASLHLPADQIRKNTGANGITINEKVVLIVAKKAAFPDMDADNFYPIGVSGVIKAINPNGFAVIQMQHRVNIESIIVNEDHTIKLTLSPRSECEDLDKETEQAKVDALVQEIRRFASGFQWKDTAEFFINQINTIEMAACVMAPALEISNEQRYEILAQDSRAQRAEIIEKTIYEFTEVGRITNEANTSQQKEFQTKYKEAAIKRQMEHLQKELDEMHPENVTDIQKFSQKIAESGMNETARQEAEKVLNRLKHEGKEGVEAAMLYDYLDFITSLSWKKEPAEPIDLKEARRILDEDHYGLAKVKDRIIQQIAVMNLKKQQSGSILLFVGAPGTGKTSIGKSIARALGREYVRVSLGGVHDESDIRGHRRTYIGSMPGRIMDGIHKSGVSNPVMVLDEVDKMSASYHGSPAGALLEVLDPEQNNTFTDHYMNVPYDLSDVLFVCTANTTDTIPQPLLDRMEVIHFTGYTPLEKLRIAREHLVAKSMETMGIPSGQLSFEDDALEALISNYTSEAGVRGLRKHIDTLCRILAVEVASNPDKDLIVTPDIVHEKMESRPIHHEEILPEPAVGVVTGLAWTPVGGEILHIETKLTPGKGDVIITGQLGDVMKESARIALSLVKSQFPEQAEQLKEHDLHIHVPAGAVPKDGPSAGVTLTAALSSLLTGNVVDPHIAMTGEVALRGAVTPIGGLPEKLMAAQRAGVTKVLIPKDNLYDMKDVAQEVKDKLEVIPVSSIMDILTQTGVIARRSE